MKAPGGGFRRSTRAESYLIFGAVSGALVILSHYSFWSLPYFWDEAGQYVPQTLDLLREGRWMPVSTPPNIHPPGVMAGLAAVWSVVGVSIESARLTMLTLAAFGLLGVFLLAIELARDVPGAPAFVAVLLMFASPLFYMQAMMVQLDMPAMVWTVWTLFWFLRGRIVLAVVASVALSLSKETGVLLPVLLAGLLAWQRRWREAAWFLIPAGLLGGWILLVWRHTGSPLGDSWFAKYNVTYALHPVRIAAALARRVWYLGFDNFHWVGLLAVAAGWRAGAFRTRPWQIAGMYAAFHVLVISCFGGAVLERYVLPVLPLFYIAVAVGLQSLAPWLRLTGTIVLCGLIASGLFFNPSFWPFPYENNLAMVDQVRLHQRVARFIEGGYPRRIVTTAWPMSIELNRPDLGYVYRPVAVRELPDFGRVGATALPYDSVDFFVLYSRDWTPPGTLYRSPVIREFATTYFGYQRPITGDDLALRYGLRLVMRWESRGQWAEVWGR